MAILGMIRSIAFWINDLVECLGLREGSSGRRGVRLGAVLASLDTKGKGMAAAGALGWPFASHRAGRMLNNRTDRLRNESKDRLGNGGVYGVYRGA